LAGIPAVVVPALSVEQHWAERVCAAPVERSGARARFTEIRSEALAFFTTSCTSVVWCGIGSGS
jgi:hypothetical protein